MRVRRTRIEAFSGGPSDATQFDVAMSPGGKRVAWVEIRANVVFGGFDFRRYSIERPGAIALYDVASAAPVRDLTAGPGDSYPSFAPNGKSVAFQRGGGVWTVRTSGGKPKRVLRGARQPAWSK